MKRIMNVAVVGCGIGRFHIDKGYLANPDLFTVKALCDLDGTKLTALADEFGIERRVTNFDDLLAMDDIDIVDICTPPMMHLPMILAALAAGKHVVCEKPLVGSLAEIDEVMAAEAKAKGRLTPIFQYRFGNGLQQAKAIIDAGLAGKPYVGTVETMWRREASYYDVPWRGKWKTELGGVLMGHAIHPHDIFVYLMGPLKSLYGRVATRVNDIEVEDCISASVELASGAVGSFTATLGSADEITRIRLAFENLTMESDHAPYNPGGAAWKILPRNDATRDAIADLLKDWKDVRGGYATQFARFHEAIETGGPLPVSSADARMSLEIVTAFYDSSRNRRDVAFPIAADHPNYRGWLPD